MKLADKIIKMSWRGRILVILTVGILLISLIPPSMISYSKYSSKGISVEHVYYTGKDKIRLAGLLYKPNPSIFQYPRPGVIVIHGYGGYKEGMEQYSYDLVQAGFVVLAYDQRGFGASEGVSDFGNALIEGKDLELSVKYLKSLDFVDESAIGITGRSYGGAMTIMGAGQLGDDINASFAISSYSNFTETFRLMEFESFQGNLMRIMTDYLGFTPDLYAPNYLTYEQANNLSEFIDLISEIRWMSAFRKFIVFENNSLKFNKTELDLHSPIFYASGVRDKSLYLAVGTDDDINPINFSSSVQDYLQNQSIESYYQVFENVGHSIEDVRLDYALINFFNEKLLNITPPNSDYLQKPVISELDTELIYPIFVIASQVTEKNTLELVLGQILDFISDFGVSFPFLVIAMILILCFCSVIFTDVLKTKQKGKEIFEGEKIVRRLDVRKKKKKVSKRKEEVLEKEIVQEFSYPNYFWFSLIVLFCFNLFLMSTWFIGQSSSVLIVFWFSVYLLVLILTIYGIKNLNQSTEQTSLNSRKSQIKSNRNEDLKQIGFYLIILISIVAFIWLFLSIIQISLSVINLPKIFGALLFTGILITLAGALCVLLDKKQLNKTNTWDDYGLSLKQIANGFCYGFVVLQTFVMVFAFYAYLVPLPQGFFMKGITYLTVAFPVLFLYYFGFEIFLRVLIQNKIKGSNRKSLVIEYILSCIIHTLVVGISGYFILMTAYPCVLTFYGIPINISGILAVFFILYSLIGTAQFMVFRTPFSTTISNTLILLPIFTFFLGF